MDAEWGAMTLAGGGGGHSKMAWMAAGFFDSNFKPWGAILDEGESSKRRILPVHINNMAT